jgi:predicted dehydrogenase
MMRPLTYGMIGGGTGSFIGAVHRRAIALDGQATLVAGALSSTREKSLASAKELGLAPERSYGSWQEMIQREAARTGDERLDFVVVVTPNHVHFEPVLAALNAGFHVACDKPLTHTAAQAEALVEAAKARGVVLAVTYNYTGYPMVKHAAQLVRSGALGQIRKVFVEYHQGWLATAIERDGHKQASWRTDPAMAGAGALGDIGSHAENLLATITGLGVESLCADVTTFVPGRKVDDDAAVLLRLSGGARGVLTCSQVCVGCENSLSIRVHGSEGSLWWRQESPSVLEFSRQGEATRLLTRGGPQGGAMGTRLPPGHPEGFHEAFANVYLGISGAIRVDGSAVYPTGADGARGVRFVQACVKSGSGGGVWVTV